MKNAMIILSTAAATLIASADVAYSQGVTPGAKLPPGSVAKPPPGSVAAPTPGGNQPPGGGGGGANVPNNFQVQSSSPTATSTPSGTVPKSPHNPNASPEVEKGWQQHQQEHGKQ